MSAQDLTGDGGVLKEIITPGVGEDVPTKGSDVKVHYVGTLTNGSKFDSSRDRNEPFNFKLGQGQVIKGWDIGVATMKRNEVAKLTIKPEYGYGSRDSGSIPANSTLIFEVELIDWDDEQDISTLRNKSFTQKVIKSNNEDNADDGDKAKIRLVARSVVFADESDKKGTVEEEVESVDSLEFTVDDEEVLPGVEKATKKLGKGDISRFRIKAGDSIIKVPADRQYLKHSEKFLNAVSKLNEQQDGKRRVLELEIEVLDVTQNPTRKAYEPQQKIEAAKVLKDEGNKLFQQGRFSLAKKRYERVNEVCDYLDSFEKEDIDFVKNSLQLPSYLNLAAVALKEKNWKQAIENCDKALAIDDKNVKGLYRRAQGYQGYGEFEKARDDLNKVLQIEPNNSTVQALLTKVKQEIVNTKAKEKQLYSRLFK